MRPEQPAHGKVAEARCCTGNASRSVFRLSPLPEAGSSGAKIEVASSTVQRKLPMLLPLAACKESSSEHSRASSSEHSRASSSGNGVRSSGMQQQQWHAAAATAAACVKRRAARSLGSVELHGGGSYAPPRRYMRPRWARVRWQVPSASRSSNSGELQAAAAASGERRAAAATESSLVQARKSGLLVTKANIDPQPPSMVVLQARAQLLETIIARRRQHKCAGDWQPPFMVVLKAGEHSCRMTTAIFFEGQARALWYHLST